MELLTRFVWSGLQFVSFVCVRVCGRLRVVSNFGDADCGAGKIHTRASEISRRRDAKGAPKIRDYRLSPGF